MEVFVNPKTGDEVRPGKSPHFPKGLVRLTSRGPGHRWRDSDGAIWVGGEFWYRKDVRGAALRRCRLSAERSGNGKGAGSLGSDHRRDGGRFVEREEASEMLKRLFYAVLGFWLLKK